MSEALDPRNFSMEEPEEKSFSVFPKGTYPFEVVSIGEFTTSQAGNLYLPLELDFFDDKGNTTRVYENLTFTQKAKFKIDAFLKCICGKNFEIGRKVDWESDEFIAWVQKQKGEAKLGLETKTGRNGNYEVNRVDAFIYEKGSAKSGPPTSAPAASAASKDDDEVDPDDIPF